MIAESDSLPTCITTRAHHTRYGKLADILNIEWNRTFKGIPYVEMCAHYLAHPDLSTIAESWWNKQAVYVSHSAGIDHLPLIDIVLALKHAAIYHYLRVEPTFVD